MRLHCPGFIAWFAAHIPFSWINEQTSACQPISSSQLKDDLFWSLQGGGEVLVHVPVLTAVPPISLTEEGKLSASGILSVKSLTMLGNKCMQ